MFRRIISLPVCEPAGTFIGAVPPGRPRTLPGMPVRKMATRSARGAVGTLTL
jgi:hypothetical protein